MRASSGAEDFLGSPVGAYLVSDTFVYGAPDADLFVTILRGRPDEAQLRLLTRLYNGELVLSPHASFFDASALEAVDPSAFAILADYLNGVGGVLRRVITKQAGVRPNGLTGAFIAGFRAAFDFTYPARVFVDRRKALSWLGRSDVAPVVDAWSEAWAVDPVLAALRALLGDSVRHTLPAAARRLGVSERSLQRRLRAANTRFQDEVSAARMTIAKRLLTETDRKLAAIAREVGCASQQSFTTMFRRLTGTTPSEFRARHR